MRIACIGYRGWALEIYDRIRTEPNCEFLMVRTKDDYEQQKIKEFRPDIALYYGWSWHVSEDITDKWTCIMLHPAPLPKYRGGSPIQNQIINGETQTVVSLFIMNRDMDAGDLIGQKEISLDGHLKDIFGRITEAGVEMTLNVIRYGYSRTKQDDSKATYFRRRKPADSEITIEEIKTKPARYLFNKIRMLEDPYPNAFIRTADGKKLLIKFAELDDE